MLGNLLDNAYKAARSRVQVCASADGAQCPLSIDDDGAGTSPTPHTGVATRRPARRDHARRRTGPGHRAGTGHPVRRHLSLGRATRWVCALLPGARRIGPAAVQSRLAAGEPACAARIQRLNGTRTASKQAPTASPPHRLTGSIRQPRPVSGSRAIGMIVEPETGPSVALVAAGGQPFAQELGPPH